MQRFVYVFQPSAVRHYLTTLNYRKPMRLVCVHLSSNKKIEGIASLVQYFLQRFTHRYVCIALKFRFVSQSYPN